MHQSTLFRMAALGCCLGGCLLLAACPDRSSAGQVLGDAAGSWDAGANGNPGGDAAAGADVERCALQPAPAPSGQLCAVTPGSGSALLIHATLLLPDRTLQGGQLLVQGERITCVGCDCQGQAGAQGATRLSCPDGVLSPGLINLHDHLGWTRAYPVQNAARYDHRHEWRKALNGKPKVPAWNVDFSDDAMAWGEVRHLLGGATSIMGEGSIDGLLRNLDWNNEGTGIWSGKNTTFPLGDKDGLMLSSGCGYPELPDAAKVAKATSWVAHVAEGVGVEARNELACLSGQQAGAIDLLGANVALNHAVGIDAEDARRLAQAGAKVVWTPRTNISLYGFTADVVLLRNLGVTLGFGTDWTVTGSMNMLRELACADLYNRDNLGGALSDREIWLMATRGSARAAGMDAVLGTLEQGKLADLTLFDGSGRSGLRAVLEASVREVALVLRGGKVLHGDAELVAALEPGSGCEALDLCGRSKRLCLERETGQNLTQLEAKLTGETYPLFFCGAPQGEPTCVPSRPGEFSGQAQGGDRDGDGVSDTDDNCPSLFNPPRPLDQGQQPDQDGDGMGDPCDPCPFQSGDCAG